MKTLVKIKRLTETAKIPQKATPGSAAVDIYADEDAIVYKDKVTAIKTGIALQFQHGYKIEAVPRSGFAFKEGISIINTPATFDADFSGEYMIGLIKHTENEYHIKKGERIAQLMLIKVEDFVFEEVDELEATERGSGGFGHSGKF